MPSIIAHVHSTGAAWARAQWNGWSQQSGRYDAAKQEKSWASFSMDGSVTIASLVHLAKAYGWSPSRATLRINGTGPQTGAASAPNGTTPAQGAQQRQHGHAARGDSAAETASAMEEEALLEELASLSLVAYDRRREEAAALLGIRVSTLDTEVAPRRPGDAQAQGQDTAVIFADPHHGTSKYPGQSCLMR